jgi:hypothetical protein
MSNKIICPKCGNNATKGELSKTEGTGKNQTITLTMTPCGCDIVVKDDHSLVKTRELFAAHDK